tara:strand:- start:4595 stop:5731 length:1137 start_codon:yes stop_codon:yes gene_type:complete
MSKNGTRNLGEKTRRIVWAQSAGRCQFENCNEPLIGHLVSGNLGANKGYVAHIIADSVKGPRGDEDLSPILANDYTNVMLLCDACHREIDRENPDAYPADRLGQMKRDHEAWVDMVLSAGPNSRSHILQFSAPIGPNETAVPFDDCVTAILPERTPAEARPIEIKVKGMHYKDTDPTYWIVQPEVLRADFASKIHGRFENSDIRHLSVFGLAPIPLLMELGRLLSDISVADVYELQREPAQWSWPENRDEVHFTRHRGAPGPKKVALKLSITNEVNDAAVVEVLGQDVSIWEISSDQHRAGIIRHKADLERFREIVRRTFDEIQNQHGSDVELSVFPATPVSCSVEFGRVWQPKAQPSFDVFDRVPDQGFVRRLRIKP